jgi:2-polyprenyl-3-methyl-5-hydroxy-6-metoxy-1,4-benzoquinol methylase
VHPPERRWNHNIHYLPVLLAALPQRCERALDVGCGEGTLTRELRRRVARVTGIDRDPALIALADAASGAGEIEYVCADFMTHAFEPASFDFIASVAALHHMDEAAALARMAGLLAPGGCLALLGIPHTSLPRELPRELAAGAVHRLIARRRGTWESPAAVVAPRRTYAELRSLLGRALPEARLRRHLLWRYSLIWTRPG